VKGLKQDQQSFKSVVAFCFVFLRSTEIESQVWRRYFSTFSREPSKIYYKELEIETPTSFSNVFVKCHGLFYFFLSAIFWLIVLEVFNKLERLLAFKRQPFAWKIPF
jgi:hypothetical protein